MPEIVLSTLNARYAHCAFGLRYLMANLGPLRERAGIIEFEAGRDPADIAAAILERRPRIVGLGAYIWNVRPLVEVVSILKRARREVVVVLGGPEVSYDLEGIEAARLADHVVQGEADLAFPELCRRLLAGDGAAPRIVAAPVPDADRIALPYDLYTAEDLAHRVIYVEASRGCPYSCEFCLSSLDVPVRRFPLEPFLAAMQKLLDRGARSFKFVDRTFNLDLRHAAAILDWFLERMRPELFLHFEVVPDRLPEALRDRIRRFPPGALQFEAGIQTFDEEVNLRIRRRQDGAAAEANLRWLREETGAHVHADLIAGLPGESLEGFAASYDRLRRCRPHEIQVGVLKRLRGTPIGRHDAEHGSVWNPNPPYEVLATAALPYEDVQRIRRFARFHDLVVNSGRFPETSRLVLDRSESPFRAFLDLSDRAYARIGRAFAIPLEGLAEFLFEHLTADRGFAPAAAATALVRDLLHGGPRRLPPFLLPFAAEPEVATASAAAAAARPGARRQDRHRRGADAAS